MHMISLVTRGPHRSLDPWEVSSSIDVDQHGDNTLSLVENINSLEIPSIPLDFG